MDIKLNTLRKNFPGRETELDLLTNFYSNPDLPYPSLIYFWGPQYTAKTKLTQKFFQFLTGHIKLIYLDFNLIFDIEQLIISILKGIKLEGVNVKDLGQLLKLISLSLGKVKVLFILDHCKNYKQNYLNQFINLSKEFDFHLLIISNLPPYQLIPSNELHTPISHHFQNYSKSELSQILSLMNPQPTKELELRYAQFNTQYLLPIIFQNSKNLKIINELSLLLITKLNQKSLGGVINLQKVKLILSKVNLFELDIKESWIPEDEEQEEDGGADEELDNISYYNAKIIDSKVENWIDAIIPLPNIVEKTYKSNNEFNQTNNLPIITKLVLMSSYIASYNKSKFDNKLFITQIGGKKIKRGRKAIKNQKLKPINQNLLGPKPFTLIRLTIIFENLKSQINQNYLLPSTTNILIELNKLKEMRLISARGVGQIKWQCEISYAYSGALFEEFGLNINHYLILEE